MKTISFYLYLGLALSFAPYVSAELPPSEQNSAKAAIPSKTAANSKANRNLPSTRKSTSLTAAQRARDAFKKKYLTVMQNSAQRKKPDPYKLVPELIEVYREVPQQTKIAFQERKRMSHALESRLVNMHGLLKKELKKFATQSSRKRSLPSASHVRSQPLSGSGVAIASTSSTRSSTSLQQKRAETSAIGGGSATAQGAQTLIDLIQNTISPNSWEINGGQGTISFYPNTPALIIRQNGEVHQQIQDTLRQLRKLQ